MKFTNIIQLVNIVALSLTLLFIYSSTSSAAPPQPTEARQDGSVSLCSTGYRLLTTIP